MSTRSEKADEMAQKVQQMRKEQRSREDDRCVSLKKMKQSLLPYYYFGRRDWFILFLY